ISARRDGRDARTSRHRPRAMTGSHAFLVPKRDEDHPPIEQTPGHVNAWADLRRSDRAVAWRSTGATAPGGGGVRDIEGAGLEFAAACFRQPPAWSRLSPPRRDHQSRRWKASTTTQARIAPEARLLRLREGRRLGNR